MPRLAGDQPPRPPDQAYDEIASALIAEAERLERERVEQKGAA